MALLARPHRLHRHTEEGCLDAGISASITHHQSRALRCRCNSHPWSVARRLERGNLCRACGAGDFWACLQNENRTKSKMTAPNPKKQKTGWRRLDGVFANATNFWVIH